VDSGDTDPASFFHHLTQAAPRTRAKTAALLTFAPEYLSELTAFTRRYFRAFFQRLPPTAVIVFDNCHEVPPEASLDGILANMLCEVREGISILMISRSNPPATLAHAEANRRITRIGGDALRLTNDELREIVLSETPVDEPTLASLQTRCDGWAAGLILMLEHLKASGTLDPAHPGETFEGAFNYFAGEVFDRVSAPTRTLLLRTAFLPRVTATAAESLTGDRNAASLLEGLFRQRLFTDEHPGEELSYQFHALFAEFLRSRVSASLPPEALRQLRADSAQWLEKSREPAAALKLWVANGEWGAATALILSQARGLVAEGRWLTLKAWIGLLPRTHVEK